MSNRPSTENRKVRLRVVGQPAPPPQRQPYRERRPREYLTDEEVDKLIAAARKRGRYGHRDATMILIAYRHGLRVSELIALTWDQVDFRQERLHVRRVKRGDPSVHPLRGVELRALRQLRRENADGQHVFVRERRGPLTSDAARKRVAAAGEASGLGFPVHPHMLRHACGYKLANDGQDTRSLQLYLGHRNIQHTVRYTELSASRFANFWRD